MIITLSDFEFIYLILTVVLIYVTIRDITYIRLRVGFMYLVAYLDLNADALGKYASSATYCLNVETWFAPLLLFSQIICTGFAFFFQHFFENF